VFADRVNGGDPTHAATSESGPKAGDVWSRRSAATSTPHQTYVTDKQERLNGSNTYHPGVSANAPAGQFWAVDVYDAESGAFIREPPVA
jgi:hypothetical protein